VGAALAVLLVAAGLIGYYVLKPMWDRRREEAPPPASGEQLKAVVLDVGQGDSILIVAPGGKSVLVDAGEPGDGKVVLDALKRHGVEQLDLFIATHAHADHIGAADEVIDKVPVGRVLYSGVPNPTRNYEDFLKAVERKGIELVRAAPDQTFELGGGAVLRVLGPTEPFFKKDDLRSGGNEPNANSVVARLDYGEFSMLLTGDAEMQTEERLMRQGANVKADVLKVGHHGSKYATSEDFLRAGEFKTAIISAGAANRYGHPSQEVLDRLRAARVRVYRTDFQGEVVITTRGTEEGNYKIETAREPRSGEDMAAGREALRDDSSRRGFIDFGDLPPAPGATPARARSNTNTNANRASGGR
jgi:beta-lactamase superfamily II metal-dependent hydrolase